MPPSPREATDAPARPYGPVGLVVSTVLILAAAALILLLIAAAAFAAVAATRGWSHAVHAVTALLSAAASDGDLADRVNIVAGGIAYAVMSCSVLLVARFRGGAEGWAGLVGWRVWDPARGLKAFVLLLAATLCYSFVASTVIESFHPAAKDWVTAPSGTVWIVGFIALATLFAPISEELLFRGWIFTSLRTAVGARFAILLSAVLFAVAHWESTHLYALAVFPVGLALGYIRQRTDSVAASITLHALYNGIAAVLLFVGR